MGTPGIKEKANIPENKKTVNKTTISDFRDFRVILVIVTVHKEACMRIIHGSTIGFDNSNSCTGVLYSRNLVIEPCSKPDPEVEAETNNLFVRIGHETDIP